MSMLALGMRCASPWASGSFDAADAEAICEAVSQYAVCGDQGDRAAGLPVLHRTRHLFIRQQTSVINVANSEDKRIPKVARVCISALYCGR
jgi:transposase